MSTEPSEALIPVPPTTDTFNNNNNNNNNNNTTATQERRIDPSRMNNLFFWAVQNSDPEKLKEMSQNADPALTKEKARQLFDSIPDSNESQSAQKLTTRRSLDPIKEIKNQLEILTKNEQERESEGITNEDRFYSLVRIQDFIDKIDFANDFHKLNGTNIMLNIIREFLDKDIFDEEVYTLSLEALDNIATCLHNNPWLQTQEQMQREIFPFVFDTLKSSKVQGRGRMQEKLVSVLAALCSSQPVSLFRFMELNGVENLLVPLVQSNIRNISTESNRLVSKLMFLLVNLMLCEESLSNKTSLASIILSNINSLFLPLLEAHKEMRDESEIDLVEKTLLVLRDLALTEHIKSDYQKMVKANTNLQDTLQNILKEVKNKEDQDRFYEVKDYIEEIKNSK
jgi:hypothetical protein